MKKMIVKDVHDGFTCEGTLSEFPSGGIHILAGDGQAMLAIRQQDNVFEISVSNTVKHEGRILDNRFSIKPVAANVVTLTIDEYRS